MAVRRWLASKKHMQQARLSAETRIIMLYVYEVYTTYEAYATGFPQKTVQLLYVYTKSVLYFSGNEFCVISSHSISTTTVLFTFKVYGCSADYTCIVLDICQPMHAAPRITN